MHDAAHEERCLLEDSGAEGCSECRAFLAAMNAASDSAQRAALTPPAWLDAEVISRAAPPLVVRPRWRRISLGLAAIAAGLALLFLPVGRSSNNLHWTNGIERDITRLDSELADISQDIASTSDAIELDADIGRIEDMAKGLKRQAL
ncbi:MAG: hypothetical protein NTY77_06670 [Elusimicrobia bacterium]|nr:hypothetical protein [Elusimicrobiota bacterium]